MQTPIELKPYYQECNGCAYSSRYKYVPFLSFVFVWDFIKKEILCQERDCRSHPLYRLMKGIK